MYSIAISTDTAKVDWQYEGKTDALLGTGATRAEGWLTWAAGISAGLLYLYFYLANAYDWAIWQYLLTALVAGEIGGGVVVNSLNSSKRFYHTPAEPEESGYVRVLKNPYLFSALHIYPLPIAVLYGAPDWLYGVFWYGALMVGTLAVLQAPLYLRRPVAMFLTLAALLVNIYFVAPVAGFEWLAPALLLKIVLGHHVQEEPYRPADLSSQSQNAKAGGPP